MTIDKLTLEFNYLGAPVKLQGKSRETLPEIKMITMKGLLKQIKSHEHGMLVVVHLIQEDSTNQPHVPVTGSCKTIQGSESLAHPKLQSLLQEFEDIFQESKALPPKRDLDHIIP